MLRLKPAVSTKGLKMLCVSAAMRISKTRLVRRRFTMIFSFTKDVESRSWT